jgi:hypothetical protein
LAEKQECRDCGVGKNDQQQDSKQEKQHQHSRITPGEVLLRKEIHGIC